MQLTYKPVSSLEFTLIASVVVHLHLLFAHFPCSHKFLGGLLAAAVVGLVVYAGASSSSTSLYTAPAVQTTTSARAVSMGMRYTRPHLTPVFSLCVSFR